MTQTHPASVRSLVLNTPLPVEANYDEHASSGMHRTLNMVFDGCAVDPLCARAYPDVRRQFQEVVASAREDPQRIDVDDATGPGKSVSVLATAWVVSNGVLGQLYSPFTFEVLPARIAGIARGNASALKAIISTAGSGTAQLMRIAVWCNEEYPFENPEAIRRQQTNFPEFAGVDQSTVPVGTCEAAGFLDPERSEFDNLPVKTDIPALIFAGELDPAIPPAWIRAMVAHMPNARVATFPGQGHGAGFNECAWSLMSAFLNGPTSVGDASCLLYERSPDFSRSARPQE